MVSMPLVLSILTPLLLFLWQGHQGFTLWDEGFLWYGVQRVLQGEVPIRDFMAYDPARYYWSALLLKVYGDEGMLALRGSVLVLQVLGLWACLHLLTGQAKKSGRFFLLTAALTLTAWMYVWYKLSDVFASIMLVAAFAYLVRAPGTRRSFIAGVCIGLAAVISRNHGVYGLLAVLALTLWLALEQENQKLRWLLHAWLSGASGIVVGFLPILLMAWLLPGFAGAFWESIRFLLEIRTTNLVLPVPWPWQADFSQGFSVDLLRKVLVGLWFIVLPVFGLIGVAALFLRRALKLAMPSPLWSASVFLALPYAHYAYSRADVDHLALGIFPLLLGILAVIARQTPRDSTGWGLLLLTVSLLVVVPQYPGWYCYRSRACVQIEAAGDRFDVDTVTAEHVALLKKLASDYAPDRRSFVALPFWPGAYALLQRKSPIWEIYALFPRGAAFERAEIERINLFAPGFAVLFDYALDGRDELRFKNTHPLIYQYIVDHFEALPGHHGSAFQVYRNLSSSTSVSP